PRRLRVLDQDEFQGRIGNREVRVAGPALRGLGREELPIEIDGGVDVRDVQGELHAGHFESPSGSPPHRRHIDRCRYLGYRIEECQYVDMPKSRPCCPPLLERTLERGDAEELSATFKALSDPGRLRL